MPEVQGLAEPVLQDSGLAGSPQPCGRDTPTSLCFLCPLTLLVSDCGHGHTGKVGGGVHPRWLVPRPLRARVSLRVPGLLHSDLASGSKPLPAPPEPGGGGGSLTPAPLETHIFQMRKDGPGNPGLLVPKMSPLPVFSGLTSRFSYRHSRIRGVSDIRGPFPPLHQVSPQRKPGPCVEMPPATRMTLAAVRRQPSTCRG